MQLSDVTVWVLMVVHLAARHSHARRIQVFWNATNPIFQISNTDHIIDVNKGNNLFEYDQVTIICPNYDQYTSEEDTEKYIIYNVSKEEYDTCRITDPNPRIIAVCDKPYKLMFFTITFRSFTPQPGGLEFRPGQDYFFISTSARGDMLRRIGGRCSTHNMKVVFKVCCNDTETNHIDQPALPGPSATSEAPSSTTVSTRAWRPPRTTTTTTRRPGTRRTFTDLHKDLYGEVLSIDVKDTKKTDEYGGKKHPNDIYAKNEGLKSGASGFSRHRDSHSALCFSIASFLLLRLITR